MDRYRLSEEVSQLVVDGILQGYKNYLSERRLKNEEMRVSTAYSWVLGNHIDDQIGQLAEENGIDYQSKKAGYSWGYLEFLLKSDDARFLMIVKNCKVIEEVFNGTNVKKGSYLADMAKVNRKAITEIKKDYKSEPVQLRLELNPNEMEAIVTEVPITVDGDHNLSYIVTYQIDPLTKRIVEIDLILPSDVGMEFFQIQSLTPYIESSKVEIMDSEYESIITDKEADNVIFSSDANEFKYSRLPKKEEESTS